MPIKTDHFPLSNSYRMESPADSGLRLVCGDLLPRILALLNSRDRARATCVCPAWQAAVDALPPPLSLDLPPSLDGAVADFFANYGAVSPCGRMFAALIPNHGTNDDDFDGVGVWSTETGKMLMNTNDAQSSMGCLFYEGPHLFTAAPGMYTVLVPCGQNAGMIVMQARLDISEVAAEDEDNDEEVVCLRPAAQALQTYVAAYFIGRDSVALFSVSARFIRVGEDAIPTLLPLVGQFALQPGGGRVVKLQFSPMGDKLVAVIVNEHDVSLRMWRMSPSWQPGEELPVVFQYRPDPPARNIGDASIAFSTSGRFLAGSIRGRVLIFDTSAPVGALPLVISFNKYSNPFVRSMCWRDDASLLVCRYVSKREMRFGNVTLHTFPLPPAVNSAVIARDLDASYVRFIPRDKNNVFIVSDTSAYFENIE